MKHIDTIWRLTGLGLDPHQIETALRLARKAHSAGEAFCSYLHTPENDDDVWTLANGPHGNTWKTLNPLRLLRKGCQELAEAIGGEVTYHLDPRGRTLTVRKDGEEVWL